jgi:chaperone LolA
LKDLKTLSATFEQRVYDETDVILETASGTLNIARPGKFSWIYSKPYRQIITSDGTTLWLYDEELAQVTVNAVEMNVAGSAAQLLGENIDLDAQYQVSELGPREDAQWVQLVPKADAQQYTGVEIGLNQETLVAMRLTDNLGQTTELRFTALQRNPSLDEKRFVFAVPPGVDVVTGAGAAQE